MGCRFSKMNDAEPEVDSDSTDITVEVVNRPLLGVSEYRFNSQSVMTSNTTESLNPTTVSDESDARRGDRTSIDYMKNTHSMIQWDAPIRSSLSDRIILKSKTSLNPQVRESIDVNINKPIKQVGSASQADFFRMLDEKIAQGSNDLVDSDTEK